MICEGAPESNVKERLFAICWRSCRVDQPPRQVMLIMAVSPPSLGIEVRTVGHECRIHLQKQEGLKAFYPRLAIIWSIPAITSALVTAAMQRKSSGHSRKKQGLHST